MITEAGNNAETVAEILPADQRAGSSHGFWAGRSGLVVAGILAAIGTYLTAGILTMDVPEGAKAPGPTFFPTLIVISIFILAALLAVQTLRKPEHVAEAAAGHRFHSDWKSLGLVFASFLAFALLLIPVGWLLSAAVLFWGVSRALGSKRPLFDLGLSLVFSSCIQLAFGAGLGLNLPGGVLEGIYG
ncbi:tripartite tricarboxylate transporter TctB family protein [Arthrobacter sp. D3-16]